MVFHAGIDRLRLRCGPNATMHKIAVFAGSQTASDTNSEEATTSAECHGLQRICMSARTREAELPSENGLGNGFVGWIAILVVDRLQYSNAV